MKFSAVSPINTGIVFIDIAITFVYFSAKVTNIFQNVSFFIKYFVLLHKIGRLPANLHIYHSNNFIWC